MRGATRVSAIGISTLPHCYWSCFYHLHLRQMEAHYACTIGPDRTSIVFRDAPDLIMSSPFQLPWQHLPALSLET
jgi:hypothetical protein